MKVPINLAPSENLKIPPPYKYPYLKFPLYSLESAQ